MSPIRLHASVFFAASLFACTQPTETADSSSSTAEELTATPVDLPPSSNPYHVTCTSLDPSSDVRVYVTETNTNRFRGMIRMTKPRVMARVYDVVPSWSGSGWNFNVPGHANSLAPFHVLVFPLGAATSRCSTAI